MNQKKVCLAIIDGWGHTKEHLKILRGDKNKTKINGNAIFTANTKNYDNILKLKSFLTLSASGSAIGLPKNKMGNSEVGHLTIGSGRVIKQSILKINELIENNFFRNYFSEKKISKNIHLIGLVSDGGIHSHIDHLLNLIDCFENKNVFVHFIADGRDTDSMCCSRYTEILLNKNCKISSISGRFYGMDRDNNFDRIEKAFKSMTVKNENKVNLKEHIKNSYEKYKSDEMILPVNLGHSIQKNDTLIFFNFRTDRMKQIVSKFYEMEYSDIFTMTDYGLKNLKNLKIICKKEKIKNTLSEIISKNKLKQLHVAETEKFAHVTYFLNGNIAEPFENEERILIKSEKVESFKEIPEMKAYQITETVIQGMQKNIPFIVLNYANPDMVGHTGDFEATKKAVEVIDECLGKLIKHSQKNDYFLIITADHGNAEIMLDGNKIVTKHTTSRVPFIVHGNASLKSEFLEKCIEFEKNNIESEILSLCDVAPTILKILGIEKPKEMTGNSLVDLDDEE